MKNRVLIIVTILTLIIMGISIYILFDKGIIFKDNNFKDYNEISFDENDPKYKDYVFYDVQWYDEILNGTNIYEDIPTKRIELLEKYSEEENNDIVSLNADDKYPLSVKIEDGKLVYFNNKHQYTSTTMTNVKKVIANTVQAFQISVINIVVLTTTGEIYYADIEPIRYDATPNDFKKFDLSYKKLESDIKYDNIKTVFSSNDYSDILIAEANENKIFYDNKYNKYSKNYISIGSVGPAYASISVDGTIEFATEERDFEYLDKKIYVQKIFYIGDEKNYTGYYNALYLLIDRQGYLYKIENDIDASKINVRNTPISRIKKIGYKVNSDEIISIMVIDEDNNSTEYEVSIKSHNNVFDSTLQLENLLLSSK